jgi:hypothetical protein
MLKFVLGLAAAAVLAGCGGGGGNGGGSDDFTYRSDRADRYLRVDRMGDPAVGTAFLSRNVGTPSPVDGNGNPVNPGTGNRFNNSDNQRDAFNRGLPVNDVRDFTFMLTRGAQINSLANYHYNVGPQLRSINLTPCSVEIVSPPSSTADVDISTCIAQVVPYLLPDVITYDPNAAPGWPNGRGFDDPVGDRLIALALLKVSGPNPPHDINTLVGVLNPAKDETGIPSPTTFPHLRDAYPFP